MHVFIVSESDLSLRVGGQKGLCKCGQYYYVTISR